MKKLLLLLIMPLLSFGQQLSLLLNEEDIVVNKKFDLQIKLSNLGSEKYSNYERPNFVNLDLINSSESVKTVITNGILTKEVIFNYTLIAKKEGSIKISPARIKIGEKFIKSKSYKTYVYQQRISSDLRIDYTHNGLEEIFLFDNKRYTGIMYNNNFRATVKNGLIDGEVIVKSLYGDTINAIINYENGVKQGRYIEFLDVSSKYNTIDIGPILLEGQFVNNLKHGKWNGYNEKNNLITEYYFEKNKLINQKCWDINTGTEEDCYEVFIFGGRYSFGDPAFNNVIEEDSLLQNKLDFHTHPFGTLNISLNSKRYKDINFDISVSRGWPSYNSGGFSDDVMIFGNKAFWGNSCQEQFRGNDDCCNISFEFNAKSIKTNESECMWWGGYGVHYNWTFDLLYNWRRPFMADVFYFSEYFR